ncbi:MAG: 6-carboxytetrahydropterin synthase [Fimbriimonadaceae bacterium]|nr:6-carboxytetrahydropterin synthase [Fimbriimonadaceae bacterium]
MRLVRRVAFSSGHRYWFADLSPEENRARFGRWASPYNHGHNYVLWVAIEGEPDPETGMVVNIKDLDAILQERVVARFDQKSINDEVPGFANRAPSLENLLRSLRDELADLPAALGGPRFVSLRLEESPDLFAELNLDPDGTDAMTLTRSYEFAASHRLDNPALSRDRNLSLYGKCNNPNGHGHNYVLEVTVGGEPDAESGMLVDIEVLDRVVEREIVDRYDHRNLNEDLEEFRGRITTSEVVAREIFRRLAPVLPAPLARIRLFETARNVFEVTAS